MESSITVPSTDLPITTHKWAQLFLRALKSIEVGEIELTTPNGDRIVFKGAVPGVRTDLIIHDWRFCERVFMQSDIGMGESYMKGEWDSTNINGLIHLAVVNEKALAKMVKGSLLSIMYYRIKHLLNRNTKKGIKRNILAHYDLGNAFYQLWLDPSMTYSSALFSDEDMSLRQAQRQKYQHILDQLNAKPGAHILEVGCGWGGFAEYAADKGYRVTGITISDEQFAFAKERVARFNCRADIQLKDYRDLEGTYDHVVSIEMFEALGKAYWPLYFKVVKRLLKKGGTAVVQSIIIRNEAFARYARGTDFIQQYIFPGGMLPSPEVFIKNAEHQGLKLTARTDFGADYAKTLSAWEANFTRAEPTVRELGFDNTFLRMWRFYLKYCQGGFEARKLGVTQFRLKS